MNIAYLVNCYPAPSHSFIRREIAGLESLGAEVSRFSIRPPPETMPDPADRCEALRTHIILQAGLGRLAWAILCVAIQAPALFFGAARAAAAMARSGGGPVRHLAYLVEACWLVRALREAGVVHLHAHFGTNPAAVARLTRLLGGPPYSFTVHGPDEFDAPAALDLAGKIQDAACVVAISAFGRSQLMRWSRPADWDRIKIVRCGVDQLFIEADGGSPTPGAPGALCTVARLSGQKGLPVLLAALARLRDRGVDFHLTLIGDGDLRGWIENEIIRRDLGGCITLTGTLSAADVHAHLKAARLFVLPSFAEGLPVVLMEALALGRPVVTTTIAGVPELVDADCGWLVAPGSDDHLADALADALAASDERLTAMGQVGRARVLAHHDAQANARQLFAAIADIQALGHPSAGGGRT